MDNFGIACNAEKSWPTAVVTSGECNGGVGSGGMLTESQNFIEEKYPARKKGKSIRDIYLYGKEIDDETCAICKSNSAVTGKIKVTPEMAQGR